MINDIIQPSISAPAQAGAIQSGEVTCMRDYEVLYIIEPELEADTVKELVEKFKGLVEEQGGTVKGIDEWGKRRLAYPINHRREGYYVLMNFNANPAVAQDLDRVLKITAGIMRHLIVRNEKTR
jgi:small subunit ribosomal protein S6